MDKNVHILIPNYNKAKFIVRTLNSITKQTYKNWQITIVDNKSTDNSIFLIKKHFKKFLERKQIRIIINKKHVSLPQNWNLCLENIGKYEYYKILCSDDTIEAQHIERAVKALRSSDNTCFAYGCNIHYIDIKDKIIGRRRYGLFGHEFLLSLFYRNCIGTPTSMVFKTNQYDNYKIEELSYVGDLKVTMDYYLKGQKVIFDKNFGANFRISSQSETTKNFGTSLMLRERRFLRLHVINNLNCNFFSKITLKMFSGIISVAEIVLFSLLKMFNFLKSFVYKKR